MHKRAEKAAEAARCAGAQGHFWEVHDWLFEGTAHLELTQIKEYARTLKLDAERFDKCLDSGEQAAAVQTDLAEATRLGLSGTPSFFLNGHFFSGIVKYDTLREMVEQESAGGGPSTHSSR
jgi:protein-disulfide isomerase